MIRIVYFSSPIIEKELLLSGSIEEWLLQSES